MLVNRKPRAREQGPRAMEQEVRTKSQRPRLCHAWTHSQVYHIYICIYIYGSLRDSNFAGFQVPEFPMQFQISRPPEFQLSRFTDFVGQTLRSQPDPFPNPCTHACRDHILRKEPSLAYIYIYALKTEGHKAHGTKDHAGAMDQEPRSKSQVYIKPRIKSQGPRAKDREPRNNQCRRGNIYRHNHFA